jgi:hypothetical protein
MKMGLGTPVFLRKSKVDDIDLIAALADTHEEVFGCNVTMDEIAGMDVLDTRDLIYELATFSGWTRWPRTSWSVRRRTVLRETFRLLGLNRSLREGLMEG